MANVTDFPWLLFAIALVVMWGSTRIGVSLSARLGNLREEVRKDYDTIQAATLTLLGLLLLLPASELAVLAMNHFVTAVLKPELLPKMFFKKSALQNTGKKQTIKCNCN